MDHDPVRRVGTYQNRVEVIVNEFGDGFGDLNSCHPGSWLFIREISMSGGLQTRVLSRRY